MEMEEVNDSGKDEEGRLLSLCLLTCCLLINAVLAALEANPATNKQQQLVLVQ